MAELQTLLESLRRGEMPTLGMDDVDALVGWLLGKGDPEPDLPKPEHDPVLQQMVFYRLDATIFSGGELRLAAAGLGAEQSADLRKTRFRRLAGAFHPDRHPDLADWLTERSQAVLRAYGRFKHGEDPDLPTRSPAPPYPGYPPPRPPQRGPFRASRARFRRAAEGLRRRFGNDRFLPHKLIGGLALLAMLPVLNLLLVSEPARVAAIGNSADGAASYSGPEELAGGTASYSAPGELADGAAAESGPGMLAGVAASERGAEELAGGMASYSGTEEVETASADSALLAAAREAMRLGEAEYAHLPSVDEQLEAMGLDTDTERLYRRIRASAQSSSTGQAAANRASARPAPSSQGLATASEASAGQRVDTGADVGTDSIGDAGSTLASPMQSAPTDSAPAGAVTRSESLGTSSAVPRAAESGPPAGDRARLAADSVADGAVDPKPPLESAPIDALASTGSSVESEIKPAIRPAQSPATLSASLQATEPRPLPELEASELTLGLLGSHPAGAVLQGYADDIEGGNLIALLTRFDRRARHGSLRGTSEIARHYQALFEQASPRRTVLKVVRVERDGERWQIETEFRIEGLQGGRVVPAQAGRARFTLAGDPLRIQRLEF